MPQIRKMERQTKRKHPQTPQVSQILFRILRHLCNLRNLRLSSVFVHLSWLQHP